MVILTNEHDDLSGEHNDLTSQELAFKATNIEISPPKNDTLRWGLSLLFFLPFNRSRLDLCIQNHDVTRHKTTINHRVIASPRQKPSCSSSKASSFPGFFHHQLTISPAPAPLPRQDRVLHGVAARGGGRQRHGLPARR